MKKLLALLFFCAGIALAQNPNPIQTVTTAPSGSCGSNGVRLLTPNGTIYTCQSGMWAPVSGGGGSGCVPVGAASQILVSDGAGGCTEATPTISGSTITASLTGAASLNLLKSSNLSDLASAATARTNLGLSVLATTVPGTGVATALTNAANASGGVCTVGGGGCPGGTGTVTVVGGGSLTSTALVTGGGTTTIQTPSATATLDTSGNISTPGSVTTGAGTGAAGFVDMGAGTAHTATGVGFQAPTSVTTPFMMTLPALPATGFMLNTGTTDPSVISYVASSGSGNVCLTTSCVMTTPNLGTPSAATLTNATGLPVSTGISGLGTGVATALATNVSGSGAICLATGSACSGGGGGITLSGACLVSSGTNYLAPFMTTVTPAANTTFTTGNLNGATLTTRGCDELLLQESSTADQATILYAAAPGANFTVVTAFRVIPDSTTPGTANAEAGACMYESSTGKYLLFGLSPGNASWIRAFATLTGAASITGENAFDAAAYQGGRWVWEKLVYDGTNVKFYWTTTDNTEPVANWKLQETFTATIAFTTAPDSGCAGVHYNGAHLGIDLAHFAMTTP